MRIILIIFLLFLPSLEAVSKSQKERLRAIETVIAKQVKERDWKTLCHLLPLFVKNKVGSKELMLLGEKLQCAELIRAVRQAEKMVFFFPKLKLKFSDCLQTALYIETILQKDGAYLSKNHTGLAFSLQSDLATQKVLIHLSERKKTNYFLKQGNEERSILYSAEMPELVVRKRVQAASLDAFRSLNGLTGILPVEAICRRGDTFMQMIKYTPYGSLLEVLKSKKLRISTRKKVSMAKDILKMLARIHDKEFVVRDLSSKNFVFDKIMKGKHIGYQSYLADLSFATSIHEVEGKKAQVNRFYRAPEAFSTLDKTGYYKTDIYALGVLFYSILFEKPAPWVKRDIIFDPITVDEEKVYRYQRLLRSYMRKRSGDLQKMQPSLKRDFEAVILTMIDPVPEKRMTAKELVERIDALLHPHHEPV